MRRWFNIALLNFGIAALIGCVLRAIYIWEIPSSASSPAERALPRGHAGLGLYRHGRVLVAG
ncbi:MAG: hypothetical protein IPL81_17375 [Flavobacteriales bacterium]|nr:hypothetical protein [Flavobacteriales bacterium]